MIDNNSIGKSANNLTMLRIDQLESGLALANICIKRLEETLRNTESDLKYWRSKASEAIDSHTRLRWPDTTGQ